MTSFLVVHVLDASVETLLMGPLTVFATLALLEIPFPSALVRGAQVIRYQHLAVAQVIRYQH